MRGQQKTRRQCRPRRRQTVHIPVMPDEALAALQPHAGGRYLDGTLGGAGHTRCCSTPPRPMAACWRLTPIRWRWNARGRCCPEAIAGGRLLLRPRQFRADGRTGAAANFAPVDGMLLDLGLSSDQLADRERGFSFAHDAPLDMRFDTTRGVVGGRSGEHAARGRAGRRALALRRGAALAGHRPAHRARRDSASRSRARRAGAAGGERRARAARRHSSGDAHVSGVAHRRQRRVGQPGGRAARGAGAAAARRAAGGHQLSLARRPHRQADSCKRRNVAASARRSCRHVSAGASHGCAS